MLNNAGNKNLENSCEGLFSIVDIDLKENQSSYGYQKRPLRDGENYKLNFLKAGPENKKFVVDGFFILKFLISVSAWK